jgi:hypothetical protein
MMLLRQIPPGSALPIYQSLRARLQGHEEILFTAMAEITANEHHPFEAPNSPAAFINKHAEIEAMLRTADLIRTRQLVLRFMLQVCRSVEAQKNVLPVTLPNEIRDSIEFRIPGQHVAVTLSPELNWLASWRIEHRGMAYSELLTLAICDSGMNEIVPAYVIEYVNTSINAYNNSLNATAAALLSISVEATLRDVLSNRGYSFTPGATSVDTFKYTQAHVSVAGLSYELNFPEARLKPAAQFDPGNGQTTMGISLRRYLNPNAAGRVDLYVLAPPTLVDHWTVSDVDQPANTKSVGGLGRALEIARNVEKFLTPTRLPLSLDQVIMAVRNNLIHLSEDALTKELSLKDDHDQPLTLRKFLDDPFTLFSFITTVVRFVGDSYLDLKTGTP